MHQLATQPLPASCERWMVYLPFDAQMFGLQMFPLILLHQCYGGYPSLVRRRSIYYIYLSAASIVKKSCGEVQQRSHITCLACDLMTAPVLGPPSDLPTGWMMVYLPFDAQMFGLQMFPLSLLHQCYGGYPSLVRRRSIYYIYLSAASIVKKSCGEVQQRSHITYIYIYFRPRITRQIGSMVTSQEIMLAA